MTTALNVGAARGVSIAACAEYTDQLYEYTPMQVKQAIVGWGGAEETADSADGEDAASYGDDRQAGADAADAIAISPP